LSLKTTKILRTSSLSRKKPGSYKKKGVEEVIEVFLKE